jgi:hypothetical protein
VTGLQRNLRLVFVEAPVAKPPFALAQEWGQSSSSCPVEVEVHQGEVMADPDPLHGVAQALLVQTSSLLCVRCVVE